ncbi:hypothetical protein Hgul01_05111 [Herpetosiphon gulosus]|uniref:Uncharacterized protein n=1 Tax=Herpetosiphon gulosus TaxID=1973496 RepID=A0ABP9X7D4_9CHLR
MILRPLLILTIRGFLGHLVYLDKKEFMNIYGTGECGLEHDFNAGNLNQRRRISANKELALILSRYVSRSSLLVNFEIDRY